MMQLKNTNRGIAFLASRTIPSESVMSCYDWAAEQKQLGRYFVGGFHSKLEKDVLHFLLKTKTAADREDFRRIES